MPTLEQATALAASLYGFKSASPTDTVYCPTDSNGDYTYCRNTELTKSFGFDLSAGDTKTVHIWSNKEGERGQDAYYKNVNSRALSTYYGNTRSQAAIYAFCVGK